MGALPRLTGAEGESAVALPSNSRSAQISKPLMEKKRRARINVSLEQLKSLLEKHYSHQVRHGDVVAVVVVGGGGDSIPNLILSKRAAQLRAFSTDPQIRKRKLEKADILELSVKYMKSLQNAVQGRGGVLEWVG